MGRKNRGGGGAGGGGGGGGGGREHTREKETRRGAGPEARCLLLGHAFQTLGCMRVELKTDSLNDKSRAAILRIGAKEEGIFRKHMMTATGRIRHTVYFSVIDSEWPEVKSRLERKLNG